MSMMRANAGDLVVSTFPNAKALPLYIAQEHGMFERLGLRVVIDHTESSAEQRANLGAGVIHVVQAAVDNALDMIVRGIDVVILMGGESGMNEFIVRRSVTCFEEFRNQTLGVDSPHTAYALQARKLLADHGLFPGQDYQVKAIGNSKKRYDALISQSGICGCVLNPPYSALARAKGFSSLGRLADLLGPYQAGGAFALRSFALKNSGLVENYIRAYIEALRWLRNHANQDKAAGILARELNVDLETAQASLADLLDPVSGFNPDARLDQAGLQNVLATRAEVMGTDARLADPSSYVDETFYERALSALDAHN